LAGRENFVGKFNIFDAFTDCDNTAAATTPQFKFNRSALSTPLLARPAAGPASWRVVCGQSWSLVYTLPCGGCG